MYDQCIETIKKTLIATKPFHEHDCEFCYEAYTQWKHMVDMFVIGILYLDQNFDYQKFTKDLEVDQRWVA
jgi:uncharacterized membrane protein